jgi:hypothetical protein
MGRSSSTHRRRIFERLQDEHGFTGGITIVKDYIALVGSVEVEIVSIPPVPDHRH